MPIRAQAIRASVQFIWRTSVVPDPCRLCRRRHRPAFPLLPLDHQPPAVHRQPRLRPNIPPEGPSTIWIAVPKPWSVGPLSVNRVYGNYT
jgi:hypothetical protein